MTTPAEAAGHLDVAIDALDAAYQALRTLPNAPFTGSNIADLSDFAATLAGMRDAITTA